MSELGDRMALIAAQLAAHCPARVVTRRLLDFTARPRSELLAGVFTLVSAGEGGYANYNGREAMDGRHEILLVGQVEVAPTAQPEDTEEAEFAMVEEVKAFVRSLPPALCSLTMKGFSQSRQMEHPYGWMVVDMEMSA